MLYSQQIGGIQMLLRRVVAHLRKQEWTAVALDFLIVVLGVFVGLQVNNWNTARADRQAEREIIAAVADDIRREREELDVGRESALMSIRAANAALIAAGQPPTVAVQFPNSNVGLLDYRSLDVSGAALEPIDTNASAWTWITARYFPSASSAAFDTLVNTGRLGIIRNVELVRKFQLYRQRWESLEGSQRAIYRELRDRAVYVGEASGLSPFTNIEPAALGALVRESPILRTTMRTHLEYTILHLSQMAAMDAQAAATLEMIDAEMAR
ncbi:MAG: hypothetical protein M0D54_10400 [Hyphomonadaceae bacterium JAD_PAG50586_4]|nr:MAG: hypothetical protein M0D54_10400 [Hyphomonadaceae bacterium JAD_PAG50586_4]